MADLGEAVRRVLDAQPVKGQAIMGQPGSVVDVLAHLEPVDPKIWLGEREPETYVIPVDGMFITPTRQTGPLEVHVYHHFPKESLSAEDDHAD